MPGPDAASVFLLVAIIALALWVALGALRRGRRHAAEDGDPLPPFDRDTAHGGAARHGPGVESLALASRICDAFQLWLAENEDRADLWSSFDQLTRELLTEHLGAARVRCYRVQPGCDTLQTIAQASRPNAVQGPSARAGLLGHVATTGREFFAGGAADGRLLADLAARSESSWTWVWPVRVNDATTGIVAVGNLRDPQTLTRDVRQTIGQLVSLCWQHVACVEQLGVVRRTDQASGVLTRNDFFTLAGHALTDSYQENEPVVLAAVALEGLRRLDDSGHWRQRDTLVEQVGCLIARRVRSDDLVGRFADDRFVVLLRRLDSGLGRLIAEKILASASERVARLGADGAHLQIRVGLAGSGFTQPALEALLVAAFEAVERAREQSLAIVSDLEARPAVAARSEHTTEAAAP